MANANGGPKCNSDSSKANNAYETKFQDMQKYIPFLERMIQRLKRAKGGTRKAQLAKMKSLYTILSDGKHRLTLDSLEKCDSILRNLYQKVEGEGELDVAQQSLSPKNKVGKLVLPPTTATKAKENEPNPNRLFGSAKKPTSGFKKNFKKQRLANVKSSCHGPQSVSIQDKSREKPSECPLKVPKRVIKVSSKISDMKSGKIKKNVFKHANKVPIPSVNTNSAKKELRNDDHNKSTLNQSETQPSTINTEDKFIENSSLTQHSTLDSDQDRLFVDSSLTHQHSTMHLGKNKVVTSSSSSVKQLSTLNSVVNKRIINSPAAQQSTSNLNKQIVDSPVTQHSTSNLAKKKVTSSSVEQPTSTNSHVNKIIIDTPATQQTASNSDERIIDSQVTQHLEQDEQIVSSSTMQHNFINSNSDNYPPIINFATAVCDRPQSSSPSQLNNKKTDSVGSFNSSQQQIVSSDFTLKTCGTIKPTLTNVNHSLLIESDELSKKQTTINVLSENKLEKRIPSSDDTVANTPTRCDQQKRLVPLPSPKDPRLARSLLNRSALNEKWKQPTNLLQENVACKTEPSQSQSLRAKLAEEITAVHKIGTSVGGALRTLTKNMSSIEQNRIANLKPGTIIDLMDKELPKTNKKSVKQEPLSNKISDHQNVKTNQSSNNAHKPALSSLSKEELEKIVVQNINNFPALPPDTKQILESISNTSSQINPTNYPGSLCNSVDIDQDSKRFDSYRNSKPNELYSRKEGNLSNSINSDQASTRFDSYQNSRTSEYYNRGEGSSSNSVSNRSYQLKLPGASNSSQNNPINYPVNLSNSVDSDQATNRFDSCQNSRTNELYSRVEGSSSNSASSDQALNRFDSCQNSRANEFYSRADGSVSNSANSDQVLTRFDSCQSSRTSEFYNRVEHLAGNYKWENSFDSVSSPFRIQSPSYSQTNFEQDTGCANDIYYNRNIGLSSPYDPPISGLSQNDNLSSYGMKYSNRDPRRRSQEQVECAPEAEDWQRSVTIPEERSRYTPDYFPGSDSIWSEENSRSSSRYHRGSMVPNSSSSSTQYGRTHMTCRSNPISPSARRSTDRFSPDDAPRRRFSTPRSNLDYPEERRYSDSRSSSERRMSDAQVKRYRDYSDVELHDRVHAKPSWSSHDRSFNTSSADRYNSFSDKSGSSQEKVYSDRIASHKRCTDSYRSSRRDTFSSPLEQLYSETRGPVTGRGYGVQNFRIPRFKSKERDHPSKKKPDKNTSKNIENEDDLKSNEQKAESISNYIKNEEDLEAVEENSQSSDSLTEKPSSNKISHLREERSSKEIIDSDDTVSKKSITCNENVTDEIPVSASHFVEEQKLIILLEKSDVESSIKQVNNTISPDHDTSDIGKLEVGGSEDKSEFERAMPADESFERSDDSSEHNKNLKAIEKQTAYKRSDSMISTTPEKPGDELDETRSSSKESGNETILIEAKTSENQKSICKENTVSNINSETTQKSMIACAENENVASISTKKNEDLKNEGVEIAHEEKKEDIQNLKDISDCGKDTSQTAKLNSNDQLRQNKEIDQPRIDSTCLENISTNETLGDNFSKLESNTQGKNNDNSIEVGFTDESVMTKKESINENENENCKIELCNTEDTESSNSGHGQLNKPNSEIQEHKNKVVHEIVEVLMKKSLQTEESKKLLAKITEKFNSEKLRKIQQILELSSDEEDNTDNKEVGSDFQEDVKPIISLGASSESDETTATHNNEDGGISSNNNNDASFNDSLKELNSATNNQITNLSETSGQCNANIKNTRRTKKITRNLRKRSNKKLAISENVETLQDLEKGKKKKSELDKLHDGLREMSLMVGIEISTGIRSCRLRNLNTTNKVEKSPEATNRKKLQKEKSSTTDEVDTCVNDSDRKDLDNREKNKDCSEHEREAVDVDSNSERHVTIIESNEAFDCQKLEGSKSKNNTEIDEDAEKNTAKSTSNLDVENKERSNDHSKCQNISKDSEKIESNCSNINPIHLQKDYDKLRAEDDLIKSLILSGSNSNLKSSFKSTPIVLMQKSNALMKNNKTFSSENYSKSNLAANSVENESKCQDQDKVIQKPCSTAVCAVVCEKVDGSQVSTEAVVRKKDSPTPKKSKKTKKKDFQQALDKNETVVIVESDKNPVISLEESNRDMVESVSPIAAEMQISSNNDDMPTNSASQSDTSSDLPIEVSRSKPDIEEGACRKRLQLEYSELPNIFTDKTYFQKDLGYKLQIPFVCKICNFSGKSIVRHYVTEHSDQDVLISRLEAKDAEEAIMKSKNKELDIKPSLFKCYMCCRTCTILASFYDHITSHTGEYRYRCQLCQFQVPNRDAIRSHLTSFHSLDCKNPGFKTAFVVDTISDLKNVFGYICSECYFVQLKQSTVEEHVKNHHNDASDAKVIRINMSSLETRAVLDTDKKDSFESHESLAKIPENCSDVGVCINRNIQENQPENHVIVDDINENSRPENNIGDNDNSNRNVQETSESIVNVSAFSCIELIDDVNEKRAIMETALQNMKGTLFNEEKIICETISDKIRELSDSWKISVSEPIASGAENVAEDEPELNIPDPLEKVVDSNELVNSCPAEVGRVSDQDVIEQLTEVLIENEDDEAIFSEETRLENCNFDATDDNSVELEESPDDTYKMSKINSLLSIFQRKSKSGEERNLNTNSDYDSDDFENEDLCNDETDFLNLISTAKYGSEIVSKVDVGPLTISRSDENMRFSCNIRCCSFTSTNPKYIVCHMGNHLDSNSKLTCSCCDEQFDSTTDTVELFKGLVRHGLEHVLPPPLPPPPPDNVPEVAEKGSDAQEQPRRGLIRVRRLSGDTLSSFSEDPVAGPSGLQQQTSNVNDSLGNVRIESVVSAANCDLETLQTLNSLHNDGHGRNPKRRRLDRSVQPVEESTESSSMSPKFLTDFFKCLIEGCRFSINDYNLFRTHLRGYHANRKRVGCKNKCIYCSIEERSLPALLCHMLSFHCHSKYQCAYCLYRSRDESNVVFHQNSVHVNEQIKMYLCELPVLGSVPPKVILKKKDMVHAFACTYRGSFDVRCPVKTYIWEDFLAHIIVHNANHFTCQICFEGMPINNKERLFQHYHTVHNMGRYQCVYCIHSEMTTEEMRGHLCKCHPDFPPEAIMRMMKPNTGHYTPFFTNGIRENYFNRLVTVSLDDLKAPEGSVIIYREEQSSAGESSQVNGVTTLAAQVLPQNEVPSPQEPSENARSQWFIPPQSMHNCQYPPLSAPSFEPVTSSAPTAHHSRAQLTMQQLNMETLSQSTLQLAMQSPKNMPFAHNSTENIPVMVDVPNLDQRNPPSTHAQLPEIVLHQPRSAAASRARLSTEQQQPMIETFEISSDSDSGNPIEMDKKRIFEINLQKAFQSSANTVIEISSDSGEDIANDEELFMCFLCNKMDLSVQKMIGHIVEDHRVTKTKIITMNQSDQEKKITKVVRSEIVICNTPIKSSLDLKTTFSMHEIDLLPNKAILSSPIYCDHCGFSNVVVKNMKIHLQNHASGKEVSSTLLVNPVPCLERNEKMFDKMVNLAGSSHSQPAKTQELIEFVAPKFVAQAERFACCECPYVTLQDTMLLNHLKAIHPETLLYACPHCDGKQVALDKIGHHLKLHDDRMYRCAYCSYHHYQRHLVGKHLSEKHPEKKPFVQIVRGPTDDGSKSVDEDESNTKSRKVWQCSFCDKYEIREHLIKVHCEKLHGINNRFKCCFCDVKSESEEDIKSHFKEKHPGNDLHVANVYDRVYIYAPLPDYTSSYDVGLPRRREKNLRDNIRGITFAEALKPSVRKIDNGPQNLSQFKCPTCSTFVCKTKLELIEHMWSEYEKTLAPTSLTIRDQMDAWINVVADEQEIKMIENEIALKESGESKERETPSDQRGNDRPKLYYRKRCSNRNTTDSSDDSIDNRKPKRVKTVKPRYKCGHCNHRTKMLMSMRRHQEHTHPHLSELILAIQENPCPKSSVPDDKRIFECQICGKQDRRKGLLDHFANTHRSSAVKISIFEGEVFKCHHCGNLEMSHSRAKNHSQIEHPNMPLNISSELQTKNLQQTKQEVKESVSCPVCQSKHLSNDSMFECVQSHMNFQCSSCHATFNARSACLLHIKKEHASESEEALIESVYLDNRTPASTSSAGNAHSPAPSTSFAGSRRSTAGSSKKAIAVKSTAKRSKHNEPNIQPKVVLDFLQSSSSN